MPKYGGRGEIWGARDIPCNRHLWLQILDFVQNARFPVKRAGRKIERLFVENRKKEKKYRYHFAICLSSGWKKGALFSIPFLVFLLYPLEKFIVVSARLSFPPFAAWETSHKKNNGKKDYFFAHGFFFIFSKGKPKFSSSYGKATAGRFLSPAFFLDDF